MAACGASDGIVASMQDGGGPLGDAFAGAADAFGDALVNPVNDAKADPLPPDVATEPCDKTGTLGPTPSNFAVHDYPGKSVEDLSAVRVIGHIDAVAKPSIGGNSYDHTTSVLNSSLRAGSVAVYCGATGGAQAYSSVTFVLPR